LAREALLTAVAEFERTSLRLQDALVNNLANCETIRRSVDDGVSMSKTMTSMGSGQLRGSLTDAMAELAAARRHLRAVCFTLATDEGLSIGAVARLWGVSRQLAQRTLQEGSQPDRRTTRQTIDKSNEP
jgi:DNA-binding phage protein